jgi:hypothetical protein
MQHSRQPLPAEGFETVNAGSIQGNLMFHRLLSSSVSAKLRHIYDMSHFGAVDSSAEWLHTCNEMTLTKHLSRTRESGSLTHD